MLGNVTAHLEASSALRDVVREPDRGPHVWFRAAALAARVTG